MKQALTDRNKINPFGTGFLQALTQVAIQELHKEMQRGMKEYFEKELMPKIMKNMSDRVKIFANELIQSEQHGPGIEFNVVVQTDMLKVSTHN